MMEMPPNRSLPAAHPTRQPLGPLVVPLFFPGPPDLPVRVHVLSLYATLDETGDRPGVVVPRPPEPEVVVAIRLYAGER